MNPWAIVGAFALVVALSLGAYRHGVTTTTDKYELQIAAKELADAKALEKMRSENAAATKKLQGEKYAAQKRIDALADELAHVRVLLPGCGDVVPVPSDPASATGGSVQAPAGRESLPNTAESPQRALDQFMDGTDSAFREADTVVNQCRVVVEWAKGLCKINNSCVESR